MYPDPSRVILLALIVIHVPEEFIDVLLKNNNLFVAPGTIFGSKGEGYIRFSLCASTEDIQEAIIRVL